MTPAGAPAGERLVTAVAPQRVKPARAERLGVLAEIAERRRADIAAELAGRTYPELRRQAASRSAPRDALGPLLRPGLHVIAEVKRRSPSAGVLAAGGSRCRRPGARLRGGRREHHLGARRAALVRRLDRRPDARSGPRSRVPVLAKEFVVDRRQLPILRAAGADLVLLLAALHGAAALRSPRAGRRATSAWSRSSRPTIAASWMRALATDARLIGLNNRDLRTLSVDPEHAPSGCAPPSPTTASSSPSRACVSRRPSPAGVRSASTPRSSARR